MRFLCKELKFGLLKKSFSFLCECVVQRLRCDFFEIATILNRKKNLSLLVYVLKKNFPSGNFMS